MGLHKVRIAIFVGLIGLSVANAFAEDEPKAKKLPKDSCAGFFDDLKDDVGLGGKKGKKNLVVKYVEDALTKIYRVTGVEGLGPFEKIKNAIAGKVRQRAFAIETIGKALEAYDSGFAVLRKEGTLLENAIGDYELQGEMLDFLRKEYGKDLTPEVEAFFAGGMDTAGRMYEKNVDRWKWDGSKDNAFWQIFRKVEKSDLTRKKDLKDTLLDFMADSLERTHKKLKSGKFSPEEIEDGIHKTRRMLREVLIVMGDFEGLFFLDERMSVKGVRSLGVKTSEKYLLNEKNLEKYAIGVPKDAFMYMLELIERFGQLKGADGMRVNLYEALTQTSHTFTDPKTFELIKALDPNGAAKASIDATKGEAAKDFKALVDDEFLLHFAKALRKAKD
ncbi:MAG: hypothetical protein JST04_17620 [Bdellovibrionales bacterium]|nr:hypothetical protein [Bdellovibrionales bacterium]